jgi:hypothetical protein
MHNVLCTLCIVPCIVYFVQSTGFLAGCTGLKGCGAMEATIRMVYVGGQFGLVTFSPLMYYFSFMQVTR